MDWNVIYEERYHLTRQAFFEHVENTKGPHLITTSMLAQLYYIKMSIGFSEKYVPWKDVIGMFDPIYRMLVKELCPFQVDIPGDVVEQIEKIDDNRDYIYAYCSNIFKPSSRFVCISNETIAVMLKLAE